MAQIRKGVVNREIFRRYSHSTTIDRGSTMKSVTVSEQLGFMGVHQLLSLYGAGKFNITFKTVPSLWLRDADLSKVLRSVNN